MMMISRPNFSDLRDLHNCANDLLHSPVIQQSLVGQHQQEMSSTVQKISELSLKLLDLCGATRDALSLVKEHLQDVHHVFRRVSVENPTDLNAKIWTQNEYGKKKLKKEVVKCLRALKGMKEDKYFSSDLSLIDDSLIVVVHVLREVRATTISIVESLLSLVSIPNPVNATNIINARKSAKGSSFTMKLMRVNCQRILLRCESMTEIESQRLEAMESSMDDLEVELDCIMRRLIRTRVLLLNILTN